MTRNTPERLAEIEAAFTEEATADFLRAHGAMPSPEEAAQFLAEQLASDLDNSEAYARGNGTPGTVLPLTIDSAIPENLPPTTPEKG